MSVAAASKNSVVVGFVAYFVGLSMMGLLIYRWSQPRIEVHTSQEASSPGGVAEPKVVVEYESLEGAEALSVSEEMGASALAPAPVATDVPVESAPAASAEDDEWK